MIELKREYSLQVLVDDVHIRETHVRDIQLCDLRMSISLDNLPIVHVSPLPETSGEQKAIQTGCEESHGSVILPFRGAGKSCTFQMNKRLVENGKLVFLLVKHVDALNDHMILAMTSPIMFRELALSLPSSSNDQEPKFVKRTFEFLDDIGACELRIRLLHVSRKVVRAGSKHISQILPTPAPLIRKVQPSLPAKPEDDNPPVRQVNRSDNQGDPMYGKMKNRNPVINLMNLK